MGNRKFVDIQTMMVELGEDIDAFREYSEDIRDREDVVIAAVTYCGSLLEHASTRLKDDWKVVRLADQEDIDALGYASERIRGDKQSVLSSVKIWGDTLKFASEELRGDKTVVLAAIGARAGAIRWASRGLKADASFIKAAKKVDESIMDYLNDEDDGL